jgi:hypothetical protein
MPSPLDPCSTNQSSRSWSPLSFFFHRNSCPLKLDFFSCFSIKTAHLASLFWYLKIEFDKMSGWYLLIDICTLSGGHMLLLHTLLRRWNYVKFVAWTYPCPFSSCLTNFNLVLNWRLTSNSKLELVHIILGSYVTRESRQLEWMVVPESHGFPHVKLALISR